jgi:bifunctional non-homologous end joining protein LigD
MAKPQTVSGQTTTSRRSRPLANAAASRSTADGVVAQLEQIEANSGEGTLHIGRGKSLHVSSLGKIYFAESGLTKGDLMRYYAWVSPLLLPLLKDRPLILKRFPNGIKGPSFFQQNAGANVPPGVRIAEVQAEDGKKSPRLIGGDLQTLLYTVQLGTIAVHPWQSRLRSSAFADYSTIDLDPGDDVPFNRVVELARRIGRLLAHLGLNGAVKTSGSSGLHIVVPLPARTTYSRSGALAQAISARIEADHPELATTERRIKARPRGTIYVDAQQNSRGKSVACAYSVRERLTAPISAPVRWDELTAKLRIEAFTIRTMPRRVARCGDVWQEAMQRRNSAGAIARVVEGR